MSPKRHKTLKSAQISKVVTKNSAMAENSAKNDTSRPTSMQKKHNDPKTAPKTVPI